MENIKINLLQQDEFDFSDWFTSEYCDYICVRDYILSGMTKEDFLNTLATDRNYNEYVESIGNIDSLKLKNPASGEEMIVVNDLQDMAKEAVKCIISNPLLLDRIKSGYYNFIIGDDVSGRMITLLVSRIIKNFANHKIKTVFIDDASLLSNVDDFDKSIQSEITGLTKYSDSYANNMLLVTDYMCSGKTVDSIRNFFQKEGKTFDVLSQKVYEPNLDDLDDIYSGELSSLFYGSAGKDPPAATMAMAFYGQKKELGLISRYNNIMVKKSVDIESGATDNGSHSIFAEKYYNKSHYIRGGEYDQSLINWRRKQINFLADYISVKLDTI